MAGMKNISAMINPLTSKSSNMLHPDRTMLVVPLASNPSMNLVVRLHQVHIAPN